MGRFVCVFVNAVCMQQNSYVFLKQGLKILNFSCLTQLSMKFIMFINVKMPTFVGILTFISMINTTFESLKARKVFIFQHFSFYEQLKFHAQLN